VTEPPWRVVIVAVPLAAVAGIDAIIRAAGHETAAVITPRRGEDPHDERRRLFHALVDGAPDHLDLCLVPSKDRIARLLRAYDPDLAICAGFPWLIPADALAVPRLGIVNGHPSLLPRHRGPYPIAWAFRDGDSELGFTFHLMDEEFDTGPILSQGTRPMPPDAAFEDLLPLFGELVQELLPRALARLAAGERGDAQSSEGATHAGPFSAADAWLDLSRPARDVHNLVRGWSAAGGFEGLRGALVELDGGRRRILRSTLADPGDGALRLECADAPLWVLEHEPG
jgi:methionyl-tRNA formyltransferase